jgi:lysophospholipase L1-like esterase
MAAILTTGTLTAGNSRTFALAPGSALTLTLLPNPRVSVTETPETVSASGVGGNAPRSHFLQYGGVFTYGPYPMGGSIVVSNASNSGSTVTWGRKDTTVSTSSDGTSLVSGDGNSLFFSPSGSVLIAGFGDSITDQNSLVNSTQSYLYANGYMTWASILSGGKLTFTDAINYGTAGDTTTMMVARLSTTLAAIYASGAKYCVVLAGTNDVYSGVTYAQTIANLATIYGGFLGLNIVPVIVPILPRAKDAASGSMLTADRQKLQRINNWIREYARTTPNVVIADPTLNIVDQAVTNGDPIGALLANTTAYTYDGLHPSARGAYWIGKAISDALQYRLSGISQALWSQIDTYDATNNPSGNLLANGYMTGTGGTNGTGSSGSVATSWTARRLVGTTGALTCSKTTVTAGNGTTYPQQTVAFVATAGSATEELQVYQQIFPSGTTYAVGDTVYAECDVSVSGITAASFRSIYLKCADDGVDGRIGQPSGAGYMPDSNWSGTMRSPAFVIKAGTTAITVSMHAQIDGTVASAGVTVNFSRMALRKVGV